MMLLDEVINSTNTTYVLQVCLKINNTFKFKIIECIDYYDAINRKTIYEKYNNIINCKLICTKLN